MQVWKSPLTYVTLLVATELPEPADLSTWWATVESMIKSLDDSFLLTLQQPLCFHSVPDPTMTRLKLMEWICITSLKVHRPTLSTGRIESYPDLSQLPTSQPAAKLSELLFDHHSGSTF